MLFPRGDGDGWARCALGHHHWGVFGAAGLLLRHGDAVLLQHRAEWSHHGGTWGILGGARNRDESAEQAARREAEEEAGLPQSGFAVAGSYVDDHGGWTYTTVIAHAEHEIVPAALTPESIDVRWVRIGDLAGLDLHPGFAATWDEVRRIA